MAATLDPLGRVSIPFYDPSKTFLGNGFTGRRLRVAFERLPISNSLVGLRIGFDQVPGRPEYVTPMLQVHGWQLDLVEPDGSLCAMPPASVEGEALEDRVYPELSFIATYTAGRPDATLAEQIYGLMQHSLHGLVLPTASGRPGPPVWRAAVCDTLVEDLMRKD